MKIQLDTDNQTVKLEDDVKLSKLISTLNKLMPRKEWSKYTLITHTTIERWHNPVVIREVDRYQRPWITWSSNDSNIQLAGANNVSAETAEYKAEKGTFNIEA